MTTEIHYWPMPAGGYAVGIGPEVVAMWGDEEVARTAVNRINAALARERTAAEARGRAVGHRRGMIAALAVVHTAGQDTLFDEIVRTEGLDSLLAACEDGDAEWSGLSAAAIRALAEKRPPSE